MYMYVYHCPYAVRGDPNFPELEIVGCPAIYDRLSETYTVNLQWRVPFSPAALSHIALLVIRESVLLDLSDGVNEFTILRTGGISNETINVSCVQQLSNIVIINVVVFLQSDFSDTSYNVITHLSPLEEDDHYYQLGVSVLPCV